MSSSIHDILANPAAALPHSRRARSMDAQMQEAFKQRKANLEMENLEGQIEKRDTDIFKNLWDIEDKRRVEMDRQKAEKATSRFERLERLSTAYSIWKTTGQDSYLKDLTEDLKDDPRTSRVAIGMLKGDPGAFSLLNMEMRTTARRAGIDLPDPHWVQIYDENDEAVYKVDATLTDISQMRTEEMIDKDWAQEDGHWAIVGQDDDGDPVVERVFPDDPRLDNGGKYLTKGEHDLLESGVMKPHQYGGKPWRERLREQEFPDLVESEREAEEAKRKKDLAEKRARYYAGNVVSSVKRAMDFVGHAGALASVSAMKSDSGAAQLKRFITTITSNNVLDTLMEMKSQSATGSTGFGALSESELDLLISRLQSLDIGMKPEELETNLRIVSNYYRKAGGLPTLWDYEPGETYSYDALMQDEENVSDYLELEQGSYVYIAGDPRQPSSWDKVER